MAEDVLHPSKPETNSCMWGRLRQFGKDTGNTLGTAGGLGAAEMPRQGDSGDGHYSSGAEKSRLVWQVEGTIQGQMSATQGGATQRVRNCLLSLMAFPQTAT